ncbi:MAG: hypothetical protein U0003_00115 [Vampirovibrionales bacterium]
MGLDWTSFSRFPLGATLSYVPEQIHTVGPGLFAQSVLSDPTLGAFGRCMYNHPLTGQPLAGPCLGGFNPPFATPGLPPGYGTGLGLNPVFGIGFGAQWGFGFNGYGVLAGPNWGYAQTPGPLGPALDGLTVGLLS